MGETGDGALISPIVHEDDESDQRRVLRQAVSYTGSALTYDAENRITSATQSGIGGMYYSYDGAGQRVQEASTYNTASELWELWGRRDMVRSGLLRDGERGFGARALALARRQGAPEFLFEARHKIGAA